MGKKQKKRGKIETREKINNLESNERTIDPKKLTEAIVKAYLIIEDKKRKEQIELEEKQRKEWQEITRQKEYSENEKWYLKKFHSMRNYLAAMWALLFFEEKNVRDLRATLALMRLAVAGTFDICKWGVYIILFVIIVSMFQIGINEISNPLTAFLVWFFARVFRIASLEIEKIRDENLLIAIFSGCISFVAMIVAIIAIFVD